MLELDSGFTVLKLNSAGQIHTSKLTAGGFSWRIWCYQRFAEDTANDRCWSLFLDPPSGAKEVNAIMEAFVLGSKLKPSCVSARRHKPGFIGWKRFVKLSELESDCVVDGWFEIMCLVIVLRENTILGNSIAVPSSEIQSHLGSLLESGDGADVSFCVNGELFRAHRAVLAARSAVFRAELLGPMSEARLSCITLQDIEPAAFEVLLQFIYTDTLPGDDKLGDSAIDMFQHLLAAADRYALNRLKLMCVQKLWENMSVDIVASALTCAEMYNCPELRSRCIDFDFVVAEDNFKKVVLTEGFMQLGQRFPSVIAELKQRVGA